MADKDVEERLKHTFHSPSGMSKLPDDLLLAHDQPCLPFLCKQDPCYKPVQALVANFAKHIQENSLQAGTLFMFSSKDASEEAVPCFLGVVLKKPMLHMLLEALVSDSGASLKLYNGMPRIVTSHELFLPFVRHDLNNVHISIDAWKCQGFLDHGSLKANPENMLVSFDLKTRLERKKHTPKPTIKLPFGMEARVKRKYTRKKTAKVKAQLNKVKSGLKVGPAKSSSGSTSASSDEDVDMDLDLDEELDPEKESEAMIPISETCKKEQEQFETITKEIEMADQTRKEVSEAIRTGDHRHRQGSFFARELGLSEVSLAVSGRSVCLHCKMLIPKDSVRFAWYYSTVRPHGWLHSYCLCDYSKKTDLLASTRSKLAEFHQAFTRGEAKNQEVADTVGKIFDSLQ